MDARSIMPGPMKHTEKWSRRYEPYRRDTGNSSGSRNQLFTTYANEASDYEYTQKQASRFDNSDDMLQRYRQNPSLRDSGKNENNGYRSVQTKQYFSRRNDEDELQHVSTIGMRRDTIVEEIYIRRSSISHNYLTSNNLPYQSVWPQSFMPSVNQETIGRGSFSFGCRRPDLQEMEKPADNVSINEECGYNSLNNNTSGNNYKIDQGDSNTNTGNMFGINDNIDHDCDDTETIGPKKSFYYGDYDDDYEKLPTILTDMFEEFYCHLCCAEMNCSQMTESHYVGKNHAKKVRQFMVEFCTKRGQPIPKKFLPGQSKNTSNMSCKLCKIDFKSQKELMDHYLGKDHRREKAKYKNVLSIPLEKKNSDQSFVCDICNVKSTDQEQLLSHYAGKRHKKNEKKMEAIKLEVNAMRMTLKINALTNASQVRESSSSVARDNAYSNEELCTSVVKLEPKDEETYECSICCVKDLTTSQWLAHLQSLDHLRESQLKDMRSVLDDEILVECTLCCVKNLTKAQLEKHVQSHEHKKEELLKRKQMAIKVEQSPELDNKILCDLCNIFLKPELFEEHKLTNAHIKALRSVNKEEALKLETIKKTDGQKLLLCTVCDLKMRDANAFTIHLSSMKHINKLAQQEIYEQYPLGFSCKKN